MELAVLGSESQAKVEATSKKQTCVTKFFQRLDGKYADEVLKVF